MSTEVAELWRYSNEIQSAISRWIEDNDHKHVHLHYKRVDQIRLLRLRTWQLRYKLSITEILNLIVQPLRNQMTGRGHNYGLGIGVRSLVGHKAEQILQDELNREYPNHEHLALWADQERERQIEAERAEDLDGIVSKSNRTPTLLQFDTPEQFISVYKKRVQHSRQVHETEVTKASRKRKAYRFSPWR